VKATWPPDEVRNFGGDASKDGQRPGAQSRAIGRTGLCLGCFDQLADAAASLYALQVIAFVTA
jgi:hypothetical protein